MVEMKPLARNAWWRRNKLFRTSSNDEVYIVILAGWRASLSKQLSSSFSVMNRCFSMIVCDY